MSLRLPTRRLRPALARGGVAAALALAGSSCRSPGDSAAYRDGMDAGYVLGSADAAKRLYWTKQALESPGEAASGRVAYYQWEEALPPGDSRQLAPAVRSDPVFVPDPAWP